MSSEASAGVSDDGSGKPITPGPETHREIVDPDALLEDRGPRSQDKTSRLPSRSRFQPPVRSPGPPRSKDSRFYDDTDWDKPFSDERPAKPPIRSLREPPTSWVAPGISSAVSNAGSDESWDLPGEDDRKESSEQNPSSLHEDRLRARQEYFHNKKELLKREEEDVKRKKELLKRRYEIERHEEKTKRREDGLRWGDDLERDVASRKNTSFGGDLNQYQHGMPLDHSYHDISPPKPYPYYPYPAMAPAYIPESGVARTRPTDLQPGEPGFCERFAQKHAGGSRQAVKCTVHMRDIFGEFSASELAGDSFWDLVVLIGRPSERIYGGPWATTCCDYVAHTWPQSVEKIKDMFKLLAAGGGRADTKKELVSVSGGDVLVSTSHHLSMDGEKELSVSFDGPAKSQADMVESLTWLFAVLQSSEDDDRPIASGIEWSQRRSDPAQARNRYELSNDLSEPLMVPYYSACWTPLLPRTACAVDFETRPRPQEMQGLEVSFELMCLLSGLEYEVVEKEGLILYGQVSESRR
jgi:hypothetical protein